MIATTNGRVERQTEDDVNARIRGQMRERIARFAASNGNEISRRLAELDREWDVERALEMNFTAVVLTGLLLGTARSRKWYVLPILASGFMVQHILQGWCPPLLVLRRLGFRTSDEIAQERFALKAMRGDFKDVPVVDEDNSQTVDTIMNAVDR